MMHVTEEPRKRPDERPAQPKPPAPTERPDSEKVEKASRESWDERSGASELRLSGDDDEEY